MFKNYIIIAFRNFWRNKIFSLINILGLSIGISASLVIYLIVQYDFSFESFQKDGDRIYRVVTEMKFADDAFKNSGVPFPLPAAAINEVKGLESFSAFYTYGGKVSIPGTAKSPVVFKHQPDITLADDHYFKLFSFYSWIAGSPAASLKEPFQVVLTESRAKAYFPGIPINNIIGREVDYNDSIHTTVVGIVKDVNENTDFTFREFISLVTVLNSGLKDNMGVTSWGSVNSQSQFFIKLIKGETKAGIEKQLEALKNKYNKDQKPDSHNSVRYLIQPLADIHFNSDYDNFEQRIANKGTLYGLLAVAIFLLLLGCINFINLSTAQAVQRAREIGIRKTIGSTRRQLVMQFLCETFLLTLVATSLSIAITPLLLHAFSDFIPQGLHFSLAAGGNHIPLFLTGLVIVITLLAGYYPSMVLSRFNAVQVLKNQSYSGRGQTRKALLRKVLTVSQFMIAQVFVMVTLIVIRQINYSVSRDLGYKKDAIIIVSTPFDFSEKNTKRFVLENKFRSIPEVEMVSLGGPSPASRGYSTSTLKYINGNKEIQTDVQLKSGDTNYLRLYHLNLIAGNNPEESDTTREYVINQAYANVLGFRNPEDAIGQLIGDSKKIPVTGVLSNFFTRSTHELIKPLAFTNCSRNEFTLHIALKPQNADGTAWSSAIEKMTEAWKLVYPDEDFGFEFYDETIKKFYESEQNIARLLKWSSGLVIFISCLGLLGLVIYSTNTRTKEIGIRKVLGASVMQIIFALSNDFIRLVMIAFIISIPIAWWFMYRWLESYAYRTNISWWIFIGTGLSMMIVAYLTLSFQTTKAAMESPLKNLRTE